MHRQDDRQQIDRRNLLARGAAFAALLATGCAREEASGRLTAQSFQLHHSFHPFETIFASFYLEQNRVR